MQANVFFHTVQQPAEMAFPTPIVPAASLLLLAIAGQETEWGARLQASGPARGFWQCEKGGAVSNVFGRQAPVLKTICTRLCVPWDLGQIFEAIAWCDALAFAIARLELACDPAPLPAVGDANAAWQTYQRVWRPGKPAPQRWPGIYAQALAALELKPVMIAAK